MQIYISYFNVKSSACYKVCSVQRTEVALTTGSNGLYYGISGTIVDSITKCYGRLIRIVCGATGRGRFDNVLPVLHQWMAAQFSEFPRCSIYLHSFHVIHGHYHRTSRIGGYPCS
jgi:hypothetical protein